MPRRSSSATSSLDGQDERGRAGHLADHQRAASARVTAARIAVERLAGARDREGDRRDDHPRPVARGDRPHRVDGRVVLVVVGQQLVARLEAQRLEHGVDAGRGVRDERQALRVGAEEPPDRVARLVQQPRQLAVRNRTGSASSRSRSARWTARTGSGHAPNEPWLRNVTAGIEPPAEVVPHSAIDRRRR